MEKTLTFDLPRDFDGESFLREFTTAHPVKREPVVNQTGVFYDTFDWRLYNKSLTLVQRQKEALLISSENGALMFSLNISAIPAFIRDFPDSAIREALQPIIEMRALLKLLQSRAQIMPLRILNDDEKTIARLVLSSEEISTPDDRKLILNRLFLEPLRGYEADFRKLAGYITDRSFPVARQHIFDRARKILSRKPAGYSTRLNIPLEPEMRADEAAKMILRFLLNIIRENENGIHKDIDTEFLHDFRVAVRRTRSLLQQLKNIFPPEITGRFRKDFARLGKTTNWLRDLDVYLLSETRYQAMLPEKLRFNIHPLFEYLQRERKKELRKINRVLNSGEYSQILNVWERFLNDAASEFPSTLGGSRPVLDVARERIYRRYRKILKSGRKITDNSPDEMLHSLRIECKRLRYLLEFFTNLFPGDEINRLIKQLKKLQDNLGLFQDFSVQEETLMGFVEKFNLENPENRQTILAIGALVGSLDSEKRAVRSAFANTFANFTSAENNSLFTELFSGL